MRKATLGFLGLATFVFAFFGPLPSAEGIRCFICGEHVMTKDTEDPQSKTRLGVIDGELATAFKKPCTENEKDDASLDCTPWFEKNPSEDKNAKQGCSKHWNKDNEIARFCAYANVDECIAGQKLCVCSSDGCNNGKAGQLGNGGGGVGPVTGGGGPVDGGEGPVDGGGGPANGGGGSGIVNREENAPSKGVKSGPLTGTMSGLAGLVTLLPTMIIFRQLWL